MRTTENYPKLNQIYYILAELHNQGKQITLCNIHAQIGIKGNEETDKAVKQANRHVRDDQKRIPHTHYYLFIRRAGNSEWQGMGK